MCSRFLIGRFGLALLALQGVAAATGCGDDDASAADAGGKPEAGAALDAQASTSDAGPERRPLDDSVVCSGELPVMRARDAATNTWYDPDWSCYERAQAPDAGAAPETGEDAGTDRATRNLSVRLIPAQLLPLLSGVKIDFFFGSSTLGAAALSRTFETDTISLQVPSDIADLSARIDAQAGTVPALAVIESRQYGLSVRADQADAEVVVILRDSRNLITNLALGGDAPDPNAALLVAAARDCRGRELSGGQFELIDSESNEPVSEGTAPGAPRGSYLQFALPTTDCTFTTGDWPAWVMANAPVNVMSDSNTRAYRLRLKGRMRETDAAPVILGEREVELFQGVISHARVYR